MDTHTSVVRPKNAFNYFYGSRINSHQGFTLLEMSIVLLIMGLLLGSVMQPMGARSVERNRAAAEKQLHNIREALVGFASVHHRLPCPVTLVGEQPAATEVCRVAEGYVPVVALGISGDYDKNGFLVDRWGQPIQYAVSLSDADNDGLPDFTSTSEMRDVGMQTLTPDLEVCDSAQCTQLRANQIPVVLVSSGARRYESQNEAENRNADSRFVSRDLDLAGDDKFDDIVLWLSANVLYTRLLQAHVLP